MSGVPPADRPITTSLFRLLDLALLTKEEQGMTGATLREWVFDVAGGPFSEGEIARYVTHRIDVRYQAFLAREGLSHEQWVAKWESMNPGKKWEESVNEDYDGDVAALTSQVNEVVCLMQEEHAFRVKLQSRRKPKS